MNVYCTLFDSSYLDKGLVLYDSLQRCEQDFRLYVFAFDNKCKDILRSEAKEHMIVVPLDEFETPELLKVKTERSRAEYCWTCTPWTIKYVLDHFHEAACTYLDSDMMFFSSPQYIFDEMQAQGCSTLLTPHRLPDTPAGRRRKAQVGEYCVEFNTFLNDENGRAALNWWAEQCLEWCFYAVHDEKGRYGDQKYLEEFPRRFNGVYVCKEYGAGIAPWNADQLELIPDVEEPYRVRVLKTEKEYPIVFCHYAAITFLNRHFVNASSGVKDRALHRVLYDTYMEKLTEQRRHLDDAYGLELYVRRKVTRNGLMAFYQCFISPVIHIRRISDIYRI